ncbi:MAG: 3-phosphoshikimate 1-carboxyvinyltransferase, partial [Deltaproteobacteria bacterium]|nr:3-phosphoshikimate 1-carboxyvinyltransferase [Deltaproteobacteria bacterium]
MRLVTSGTVHGSAQAPSSKSMMQRAVAAAALSSGTTHILNPSFSDDGRASLRIISALGAKVRVEGDTVEITGGGDPTGEPLDCGESGLSIRLFSAIAALHSQELTLLARGSLAKRPMGMIAPTLRDLGARVDSVDGYPPLTISGPIRGGDIVVDGSVSSQFVSGLLMALPCCETDSVLRVHALKSAPYVHMTLQMMEEFGVRAEPNSDLSEIRVRGRQRYEATKVTIEGDWSGSAFLLVAGAIAGRVTVNGLRGDSRQADRAIVDALLLAGANVTMSEDSVTAQYSSLRG